MKQREQIIYNYVHAYNNFDIDGMLIHLDHDILFNNVYEGKINMTLEGAKSLSLKGNPYLSFLSKKL